jgi:predicted DNA-binding transcriptional regulator YafY
LELSKLARSVLWQECGENTMPSDAKLRDPIFMWWMSLPKESLTAAERTTPTCRTLDAAIRRKKIVSILYWPGPERPNAQVLLHPAELYRREGQLYVEGKGYPAGNMRILKLNRILEARMADPDLVHPGFSKRVPHPRNKKHRRGVAERARFVLLELLVLLFCAIIYELQQLMGPTIIF